MSDLTDINQIGRVAPRTVERPDRTNGNLKQEPEGASEGRTPDPSLALEIASNASATAEGRAAHDEGISADELLDPIDQHIKEIGQDEKHPLYRQAIGKAAFERTAFGDRNPRLSAPARKGFHRHWFIDKPGRIDRGLRAGWKFVKDHDGTNMLRVTGGYQLETKEGQKSYYMEMPQEWYEADQRATLQAVAETEATIRRGEVAVGDGKYVPRDPATGNMMVHMEIERHGSALAPLVPIRR